jgi:hypothetical protein
MTKRDFQIIADVLRERRAFYRNPSVAAKVLDAVAADMANQLAAMNPRFNRAMFMRACGC